jgi:S-adenosylmethionine hydrolase
VLKDQIRGSIIHIDQYENIVVNIQRELFDRIGRGRPFELYYKRFDPLTELSSHYTDVSPGDTLCLFNSTGFLEIAVHLGQAATLYGLSVDDAVQIIFHDE